MLKVHHRLLCGRDFDYTNWFLAPEPISAVIMEGPAADALLILLIGSIFSSGLIDQELRHFFGFILCFLFSGCLVSFFRQIGCFLSGPLRTPIASIVQSTT